MNTGNVSEIRPVFPGDVIERDARHCLGIYNGRAVVAGILCRVQDVYFVKSKARKYTPVRHDIVIGTITLVAGDHYKVDVSGYTGYLSTLGFLNAVKRNKPMLKKDDIVAARVLRIDDGDLLLSCKEDGLGKIEEAFFVGSVKARALYIGTFLKEIGRRFSFRALIGTNGYVMVEGTPETRREVLKQIEDYAV